MLLEDPPRLLGFRELGIVLTLVDISCEAVNRPADAALDDDIAGAANTVTPLSSLEPPARDQEVEDKEQRKEESDDMAKQSIRQQQIDNVARCYFSQGC